MDGCARETPLPSLARLRRHRTTRDASSLPRLSLEHALVARATVCDAHRAIGSIASRACNGRGCCVPPSTSHDSSFTPIHRGIHVIPSHPIPSARSRVIASTRVHYEKKTRSASIPIRPPRPGCLVGGWVWGGTYTRVTTPQSKTQTDDARTHDTNDDTHKTNTQKKPRAMKTDTENRTFTTTITPRSRPPRPSRARFFHPPASTSRRGRCARRRRWGQTRRGTRRRALDSRRASDRSRDETTTTDSDAGFVDVSTSPSNARERIRAFIHSRVRAHSRAFVRSNDGRVRERRGLRRGIRERW